MSSSPVSAVVSCPARDATSPSEIAEPDASWFSADEVPVHHSSAFEGWARATVTRTPRVEFSGGNGLHRRAGRGDV